jgi:hypothetical protein
MTRLIKNIIAAAFLISLFILSGSFKGKSKDGCERTKLLEKAAPRLKKFTIIQDYPYTFKKKKKNGQIEYSKNIVTLNRGIRYRFYAVRNEELEGLPIVTVYNNEKQEIMLASTYNAGRKVFYDEIEFECKTTGNYCLSFSFLEGVEGCALGIFASNITID